MRPRRSRAPRVVAAVVGGLIVLLIGIFIGGHPSWVPAPLRSTFVDDSDGRLVDQAMNLLARDYYRPINRDVIVNRGLAAAIASLNDPYSHYFDPSTYQSFLNQSNPHLSGIGVDVDVKVGPQGLRIIDVFPGSPAAKAGLAGGDVIVRVGDIPLVGRSSDFASRLIKGPAGTKVNLTVLSGGHRRVVTITRADIVVPVTSGKVVTVRGKKIGIVSLTSFTDGSGEELRSQVQRVMRQGAQAIVLDLRENGGGLLEEAVTAASIFIPDGTIVSTSGRSQPRQVYVARGDAIAPHIPLVVLVDGGTASAAEILTSALQDRGRAKVVGTRTYGKGVFQEIQTLSNGGALDITTGQWFEPNGHNVGGPGVIRGTGIEPDISAATTLRGPGDHALTVAEQTVASEIQ
jgi:carboxyl-terminal processing protease